MNGKARRHLRGLGHHLEPVVRVGQAGVTEGVIRAAEVALLDHELIKVRVREAPENQKVVGAKLAEACDAELVQVLGKTFLLYRAHPEEPKIKLPD
ncbi:MAG: ribosome assembly RNA-binding protein YhbY [Deltaproteobacteria bacterium]|nr:ribosome assembly RNA-binding protein YhbY [Deltaproteobacteria bacterium]